MAAKPFENRIQNLVYNVDVGIGLRLIKGGLYILFILIVMLLYTATQFRGLKDPEAMDNAQLGRNLMTHGRFITQCVRPASMWYLVKNSSQHKAQIDAHPDILHAPLWPAVLAAGFKLSGTSFVSDKVSAMFAPEQWVVIPMCHLFTLLTGIILFLMTRRLFDRRMALLAVTMFFLSDTVWSDSISGLSVSFVTFLATAALYATTLAVLLREEDAPAMKWMMALAASVVLCAMAFWTRYAAATLVPGIALMIGLLFPRNGWKWATGFVVVFLVLASPWLVRNVMVSGSPFGLAPYTTLDASVTPGNSTFERDLSPAITPGKLLGEVKGRAMENIAKFYQGSIRSLGDGLFICFFLTAFFYRFMRTAVHVLRWGMALSMALLIIVASAFGESTIRLLHMFWPLIIVYGLAFFFILLDRLQLRVRLYNLALTTLFMLLGAMPLILTMLPPRAPMPYPPYFPPFIMHVSKMLTPEEMICTDMPWATAWYGNRNSLLLPDTVDDFYEINDFHKKVSGLYFTTITRDKPFVRGLLMGPEKTWFPIQEGRIPSDFPLTQGFPLGNMDQLFLTDRVRWNQ